MGRFPPITDDRGTPVPIFDLERMRGSPALAHPDTAFTIRRAGAEFGLAGRLPLGVIDTLLGTSLLFAALAMHIQLRLAILPGVILFYLIRALYAPRVLRLGSARRAPRVIDQVLRVGVCPSCAYDLAGLHAGEDGCVCCAECGAAWRASRIGRTEPLRGPDAGATHGAADFLEPSQHHARDARGQRVPLLYVKPRAIRRLTWPEGTRPRLEFALAAARRATRLDRWPVSVFLFCAAGAGVAGQVWLGRRIAAESASGRLTGNDLAIVLGLTLIPIGLLVAGLHTLAGRTLLSLRGAARAFASTGICPSCFTDLSIAPPEPDGCTACPMCGAAWRVAPTSAPNETHEH